jgi:hypothetical protein
LIIITARLSIGGLILANTGWESALNNIAIRIDTRDQHAVLRVLLQRCGVAGRQKRPGGVLVGEPKAD